MDGAIDPLELLSQLEKLLESDPLIDEVGFIHPSQFAVLDEEVHKSSSLSSRTFPHPDGVLQSKMPMENTLDTFFWSRAHKLGISTLALLPLYTAAKDAFMNALNQYKMLSKFQFWENESEDDYTSKTSALSITGSEVMQHSKALLLLSSDFVTAWNARKLILSKKLHIQMFMDELLLSTMVLSYSPKSDSAWSHRRWVIKMMAGEGSNLQEIVEKESELVATIAEAHEPGNKITDDALLRKCLTERHHIDGVVIGSLVLGYCAYYSFWEYHTLKSYTDKKKNGNLKRIIYVLKERNRKRSPPWKLTPKKYLTKEEAIFEVEP